MMAGSHVAVGLMAATTYSTLIGTPFGPVTAAAAAFGSLLPDLDHPGSFLGRRVVRFGAFLSALAALAQWGVGFPVPASVLGLTVGFTLTPVALYLVGHRGITHSLLGVGASLVVLALFGWLGNPVVVAAVIGYLAHLAGDLLTGEGIPLLWPAGRRYGLLGVRTGGLLEWLVVVAGIGGWVLGMSSYDWPLFGVLSYPESLLWPLRRV